MIVGDYRGYAFLSVPIPFCFKNIGSFPFMLIFPWLSCSTVK